MQLDTRVVMVMVGQTPVLVFGGIEVVPEDVCKVECVAEVGDPMSVELVSSGIDRVGEYNLGVDVGKQSSMAVMYEVPPQGGAK